MYVFYQPNNKDKTNKSPDCVIRAITKAENLKWLEVFDDLVAVARRKQSMPNHDNVYNSYLRSRGYQVIGFKIQRGKTRPTVRSFADEHPKGTFILKCAHHIVAVVDGNYYDKFNSGDLSVYKYWTKV